MEELFREKSKKIRLYLGIEKTQDPFEKNVTITELHSFPIKAIVMDLIFSKIQWAMPGVVTDKAKEIVIQKRYESLLLNSQKIKIGNEYYQGWRQNGKLQYRIEGDYCRVYVYIKKES